MFVRRSRATDRYAGHGRELQLKQLRGLLKCARHTEIGRKYDFSGILDSDDLYAAYAAKVPTCAYEEIRADVMRMIDGERDILWPGRCRNYAQSSGTSGGRSKFIPITGRNLHKCHYRGAFDCVAHYLRHNPKSRIFSGKAFVLGGSFASEVKPRDPRVRIGDLSATLINRINPVANKFRVPDMHTALLPDWTEKLPALVEASKNENITNISGVPSWFLTVIKEVIAKKGVEKISEVWPNLEVFFHGGISFEPYREIYTQLTDPAKMHFLETYNASEGFFAIADDPARDDMLLMLDYGTFYEFRRGTEIVPLEGVRAGETYAMLVTSDNGLWRYEIGDTVTFTSTDPYRIRFAGRTRQFLNVFGEEVIVDNAERALTEACRRTGAQVEEYTVAPRFMTLERSGAHEWWVEFRREPDDRERFAGELDEALRRINSDYDAKRRTTLERLSLNVMAPGSFLRWMRRTGKNKVPRMAGDRRVAEEIARIAASPLRAEGR